MTMVELAEEDGPKDSATTTEASAGDKEYTTIPRYWRKRQRRRGLDNWAEESTTTTEASAEDRQRVQVIVDDN